MGDPRNYYVEQNKLDTKNSYWFQLYKVQNQAKLFCNVRNRIVVTTGQEKGG